MPSTKSSKKRLRQSITRAVRNRAIKTAVRGQIKKVRKAIEAGDQEACQVELRLAAIKLDKAAARSIIHCNAAARTKSRLSKAVKGLSEKSEAV